MADGTEIRTLPERPAEVRAPPRIAVLVLHGVGQQSRFETLASFAAGLTGVEAPLKPSRRMPIVLDDRIDSAISLQMDGFTLDLFEYHYQPLMQRQVSLADVADWIVRTGFHIRLLYERFSFEHQGRDPIAEDPQKIVASGGRDAAPKPAVDLELFRINYMLGQKGRFASRLVFRLAQALNHLQGFRNFPLSGLLRRALSLLVGGTLDPLLREFAGDAIIYTTLDENQALYAVRRNVLGGCLDKLVALLRARDRDGRLRYDRIYVAGHSLGSVVAYDAVSQIAAEADAACGEAQRTKHGLSEEELGRIGGLLTFGSPLDKIALTFWPTADGEDGNAMDRGDANADLASHRTEWAQRRLDIRRGLLKHFHGLNGIDAQLLGRSSLLQPPARALQDLAWLNVYHRDDLIAGRLDAFTRVENRELKVDVSGRFAATRTRRAHALYWSEPMIYLWLLGRIRAWLAVTSRSRGRLGTGPTS